MSYQSHFGRRDPAESFRQPEACDASWAAEAGADYTLAHRGRRLRIGPLAFWAIAGAVVVMAVWSAATATYFAFRDDLLTRLIARNAEMQYGYEDRIAELRVQVDRLLSRQLLDQEQFEQKLEQIVRRQSALEARAAALSEGPDRTPTGTAKPPVRSDGAENPAKPAPISDTVILVAPPDREARLQSRDLPVVGNRAAAKSAAGLDALLARLQDSLDGVEARQVAALNGLEESYDVKARRMRGVLADLGLDLSKVPPAAAAATGGPFIPVVPRPDASPFERQLYRINIARAQVERLTRALVAVPVRKPIPGELETTSGFGVRLDPFMRAPAMHTGVDFRGNVGDPVRATAAGKVIQAGWSGGYGRMVEVDHGNGFSTRYGHLSAIDVEEGQTIRIGQIIGRIGTTGRSTGPHLHYETRVDGEPVDPQKFLRAALRLSGAL